MSVDDELDWTCPNCGYKPEKAIERERHKAGVDEKRLECPRQDIEAINAQAQPLKRSMYNGMPWG